MAAVLSPAKDDLAQVARAEEALSRLARHAVRNAPDRRRVLASDFCAAPAIPKVDPTMRPVCSNNEQSSFRKSISSRAATQILLPMFLMAGLGVAATLAAVQEKGQRVGAGEIRRLGLHSQRKQAGPPYPQLMGRPRSNLQRPPRRPRMRSCLRRLQRHRRYPSNSRQWLAI